MRYRFLALRWLALVTMAVWLGGFTFYSAVVVPALEEVMGKVAAGESVTRFVTVPLNQIAWLTVGVWTVLAMTEWRLGPKWLRLARAALIAIDGVTLAWMHLTHGVLGRMLDSGTKNGFYTLHERYLIASTVQWGANLALIALSLAVWQAGDRAASEARGA